jgi:hypothetical protein
MILKRTENSVTCTVLCGAWFSRKSGSKLATGRRLKIADCQPAHESYSSVYRTPEFDYAQTHEIPVSDRGPDHGNRIIVSLVTNRRLLTVLHCVWKDIVAAPAFILTHFVRSTQSWFLNSTQSPVLFLRVIVLE